MEGAVLVAKMRLHSVETSFYNSKDKTETVKLDAVGGDTSENKTWAKYTPSGRLELSIDNPEAQGKLEGDGEYLVYLVPCPKGE